MLNQRSVLALAIGLWLAVSPALFSAELAPTNGTAGATQQTNNHEALRFYLQMQDQLHSAMLEMKAGRAAAEAAEQRNTDLMNARLNMLEEALRNQRAQELVRQQTANQTLLIVAGIFGAVTLAVMLLMAWLQHRTMERLTEIATTLPGVKLLGAGTTDIPALPQGSGLLTALERLEKKVQHTGDLPTQADEPANGKPAGKVNQEFYSPEKIRQREALIGRAETCVQLNQPDEALTCLDQALGFEPGSVDLLIKKATLLMDLKRHDDALLCLDQVIAADPGVTLAYLRKGALFNQLGRFKEALACYDMALRYQEKRHA
jgi:tetratricopeptide (TPR) repeat protein